VGTPWVGRRNADRCSCIRAGQTMSTDSILRIAVNPSRKLPRFESSTRHTVHVRRLTWENPVRRRSHWVPLSPG
jgi:hypothetical protein